MKEMRSEYHEIVSKAYNHSMFTVTDINSYSSLATVTCIAPKLYVQALFTDLDIESYML